MIIQRLSVVLLLLSAHEITYAQLDQGGETCANTVQVFNLPFQDNGLTGQTDDCIGQAFRDVFYQFTAPASGQYNAGMCGSPTNGYLQIWPQNSCCVAPLFSADVGCGDDPFISFPLLAGHTIIIECGSATPTPTPEPYAFQLTGPPPCNGTVQLNSTLLSFPPTYVGTQSQLSLTITNGGAGNLCVDSITTTGHIWSVPSASFTLTSGQERVLDVTFLPTFEHDFAGTIEIYSSDQVNPRDSVNVVGIGCRPALPPPAPRLYDAASPTNLYFSIPWDQNGSSIEYTIEFSSDNFANSHYVAFPFGSQSQPDYQTAAAWGHYGRGLITDLAPSTTYSVRLRARDCTGYEVIGASSSLATRDSVVMSPLTITIRNVNENTVELNWDSTMTDSAGTPLATLGFSVFAGDRPDSIEEFLGQTTSGSLLISTTAAQKLFFVVEPQLTGFYSGAHPFIVWPPDGATLSGRNTVVLQDLLHVSEWDSFRIEIDSAATTALLGSNFDNTSDLASRREAIANFQRFASGPHLISATVVDHQGIIHRDSVHVTVVPRPYVTFDAAYDSARQIFTCDTADAAGITGSIADILWTIEHTDERYGGEVFFPPQPPDSFLLVKPELILEDRVLDESAKWFEDRPGENGGVTQQTHNPGNPSTTIVCCCTDITLSTSGTSEGEYKHKKNWALGPIVRCAGGQYEVGFAFEWTIHLMLIAEMELTWCQWGQDAKGTRVTTVGKCSGPGDSTFTARARPDSIFKVDPHGVKFPFSGTGLGNDDYRSSKESTWQDWDLKNGLIHGLDIPADVGNIPSGKAVHSVGHNMFMVQAQPECFPPPIRCCKQFELHWDVTFCQHCRSTIQTVPPHVTDPVTPASCPALAAD